MVTNNTAGAPSKLSSKRQRMMKRAQAVEEQESNVGEKVQESVTPSPPPKPAAKSHVKSKVRLFQEKSQSLDLDNQRVEYNKNDVKLKNQECYNRVRQKGLLQRNHSVNIEADLAEERRVRREVRKLNAWLVQKSMEHQDRQECSKTELLRSRTTATEKKTLLPESAFKSFDSSSIVSSIEDEIHKLTIEADVHNGNVVTLEPETDKVSTESDSDLLLEAKLIRTEGKLAKLASIDELIEYEQGENRG